jgi:hypothetical protein
MADAVVEDLLQLLTAAHGPSTTFNRDIGVSAHGGKADVTATYRDVAVGPEPDLRPGFGLSVGS